MSPLYYEDKIHNLSAGRTLFDYADSLKVRVPTSCGRNGECHECILEVKRGIQALSAPEDIEGFLQGNYRLACQAVVVDSNADVEFTVLRRQPRILTDSVRRKFELQPLTVRRGNDVCFREERIDGYKGHIFGLAVDVGTTTVVLNLVNLESGDVVHTSSFENPQKIGGSDVMHRISYDGGEFKGELQQVILSSLNFEIGEMSRVLGFHRRRIYEVVIVGNSTMRDILFGIDVTPIGERPYKSKIQLSAESGERNTTALEMQAKDLGLRIFPGANVYSGPLISSHLGSDVAADLLAIGMHEENGLAMLIDVGTNTEVIVGNRHRMMAASCPAGPAFEGGQIAFGMPGYDGAVEAVQFGGSGVDYKTIGGIPAQGICGSGLVDLLAELRRTGRINDLGVFKDGSDKFFFTDDGLMSISRADLSALAQAKSANYCGQRIVMDQFGIKTNELSRLCLAGGFANYLNVSNAVNIGFIANVHPDKVEKVGNAALEGATTMLLSGQMREVVEELIKHIEHIELETFPDFFDFFVEGCMFKPMEA